jgi:hypothetical protein
LDGETFERCLSNRVTISKRYGRSEKECSVSA